MIRCCKDCPDRVVSCHSTCIKYKTEKAEYDKQVKEARLRKKYIPQSKDFDKVSYYNTKNTKRSRSEHRNHPNNK